MQSGSTKRWQIKYSNSLCDLWREQPINRGAKGIDMSNAATAAIIVHGDNDIARPSPGGGRHDVVVIVFVSVQSRE